MLSIISERKYSLVKSISNSIKVIESYMLTEFYSINLNSSLIFYWCSTKPDSVKVVPKVSAIRLSKHRVVL